jgi:hypothetical protein
MANAARFFLLTDPNLTEHLLKLCQQLRPEDPQWSENLAHFYSLGQRREDAGKALKELERMETKIKGEAEKGHVLVEMARNLFLLGEYEKAEVLALRAVIASSKSTPTIAVGDVFHQGNLILGRIALKSGDVDKAKAFLINSAKTSDAPVLAAFGPNMMLAKQLLDRGERDIVLEFLNMCSSLWQSENHEAEKWIYEIKNGRIPEFANAFLY